MADTAVIDRSAKSRQEPDRPDVWSALRVAQSAFGHIGKSATGQARGGKYQYAALDEVLETLRPALVANGLTSTALPFVEGEFMLLRRILTHAASETHIECVYPVASITRPPQEIGSALTYARRYSLLAICDVHPTDEDDDGEKAMKPQPMQVRSAHSLRKENVWPPLMKALKLVESSAELQAFKEAQADLVAQFPEPWKEQLEEEIEKHVEWVKEERRKAREAREALA